MIVYEMVPIETLKIVPPLESAPGCLQALSVACWVVAAALQVAVLHGYVICLCCRTLKGEPMGVNGPNAGTCYHHCLGVGLLEACPFKASMR